MRKILLKLIIWTIRKYFLTTIKPIFAGEKVIFYQFNWSADVQEKNTSYTDLVNHFKYLKLEIKQVDRKIKEIDKSIESNPVRQVGNYTDRLVIFGKKSSI